MSRAINWALALILSAVILAPTAQGAELVVHGVSHHFNDRQHPDGRGWNERNEGAGLRWSMSPVLHVQTGAYRNSIDRTSLYALGEWLPVAVGPVQLGVFGGVATGYPSLHYGVGAPMARVNISDRAALVARWTPKLSDKGSAVLSFELAVKLP